MKKKLILATKNTHKITEIKAMLEEFDILSLSDIGFESDIAETGTTALENAKIKALAVRKFCNEKGIEYPVIADDSGLYINALGGEPGVNSARYAGDHNDEANRQKVLSKMEGKIDRTAYYECAICYASPSEVKLFKGRTFGEITTEKIGDESFCYDCIFYSADLKKTFGESTEAEKDAVSHRGRAIAEFKAWVNNTSNPNFDRTLKFNK